MGAGRSEYLDRLYQLAGNGFSGEDHEHGGHGHHGPEECEHTPAGMGGIDPQCRDELKLAALKGVTKHMCQKSIPCDHECDADLEDDVMREVDRYFQARNGKLLQYFADTRNSVTDRVLEAIDSVLDNDPTLAEDEDQFVSTVVDQVGKDQDVEEVLDRIEGDIKQSAEDDITKIIDKVRDDDAEGEGESPAPVEEQPQPDNPLEESIFHHYLMSHYREAEVPDDIEAMLVKPMIETALHYVTRVLFSDGFNRRNLEQDTTTHIWS